MPTWLTFESTAWGHTGRFDYCPAVETRFPRQSTKIQAVTDERGLPITPRLTAGQAHGGRSANEIPGTVGSGQTLLADVACDSNRLCDCLATVGAKAVIRAIPRRSTPPPFDRDAYRCRNRIKRSLSKLKHHRAIATRREKRNANFLASIKLVATHIWFPV